MSEYEPQLESILVADCGHATTKVVLIDLVEGQYRFVARAESLSTAGQPWQDLSVGVVDAIQNLQAFTGRKFLDEQGQLITPELENGQGVDGFLAISSAASPLRVILAGLVRDVSIASARRAVLATYANIVDVISLEQPPGKDGPRTDDEAINAIWHAAPDVVCIVGGTDGGASTPLLRLVRDVVRVAVYLMGEAAPPVLFAGNAQLAEQITKVFEGLASVQVIDNVRPLPDAENITSLQEELEVMFYDHKMAHTPGIGTLGRWSQSVVLPTARASDYMVRFCEQAWKTGKPALAVDVGSATVALNVCRNGRALTTVCTDLGVGYGMRSLLDQIDLNDILRWVPFEIAPVDARDRLLNQALHPTSIPQTREDLWLVQAAAREAIRLALADSLPGWPLREGMPGNLLPPCDPLIGLGHLLTRAPTGGQAALILLDALQPTGISNLFLDERNLVPALGAVGAIEPLALVQTLRNGGLTFLGTAVAPVGSGHPGDTALALRGVDKAAGVSAEIKCGEVSVFPFHFEKKTLLELIPARGFDIGQGRGKSCTIEYREGSVGLIVDARGRPLELPHDAARRCARLEYWLSALGPDTSETKVGERTN
ncbi:MAG: glutamate mutase L [Anaerolineae bacterium]|nr:glutamate mutase L [Anaerolineae bacterium]